jgi:two-component system phosphate regulon sensor histidine kinase PhoR
MKKKTIWTVAIIMGLSFLALLFLQIKYISEMVGMKKEQFDESVNRSLNQVSRNLELNETLRFLEKDIGAARRKSLESDSVVSALNQDLPHGKGYSSFQSKQEAVDRASVPKVLIVRNDKSTLSQTNKSMQEIVRNRYVYQKALLDQVVMSILYSASEKPLEERVNFRMLDQDLKVELQNNGISIPYHFTVTTQEGREVYRCPDYDDKGEEYTYEQVLYRNDPANRTGIVRIHFPEMNDYIFSSIRFMIPAIVFTFILLVTFIFTIVVVFRQKRYSEIKNDFINNMTHELKTPISSISLAAQMLNDESLTKSPAMMAHIGGAIQEESKRLRFLVEKVLQMSMFDKHDAIFKKKELDLNELMESVANTFTLRVEHTGGKIITEVGAVESAIYVDEMHFTNVIFNLIDNAIKYRKPDQPVNLYLKTWNDSDNVYLSVKDDGVGIKKENLKKIFDKFYRVHTGNVHDVKGFGLGLAYVKNIVALHKGDIKVESEYGKGTKFTISLPFIKE